MKIGILTLPITENYGGILQAVALYHYLEKMGHQPILIYKKTALTPWKEAIRKVLETIPGHNLFNVKVTKKSRKGWKERRDLHLPFINQEIPQISPHFTTTQELSLYAKEQKFDAIIVGSDQVWRKAYINDKYYKSYFLDFIPTNSHTKKIAYAASFGKDYWEGVNDEEEISKLLSDFTAISVREKSGMDICKNTFHIDNVQHVLDPTLLHEKELYLEMINKYDLSKTPKKKLVTYVLDESVEKQQIIQHYQNELGITESETRHLRGFNSEKYTYTVPEWVNSIAQADFVITDSFHGMVFSIIFEKQFIVIGNKDRGSERFTSLLSSLNLEKHLISLKAPSLIKNINYQLINLKIKNLKKKSTIYLNDVLYNQM